MNFFTPFYQFTFEFSIGFLSDFVKISIIKKRKRNFDSNFKLEIELLKFFYNKNRLIVISLKLTFQNDQDGFIDSLKFDKLVTVLSNLYDSEQKLTENFIDFCELLNQSVVACFVLLQDDFKMKTLHYQV